MTAATTRHDIVGDLAMNLLHQSLARDRMREHGRLVADTLHRQRVGRLAAARRLQRRADSASRRARTLLLSL